MTSAGARYGVRVHATPGPKADQLTEVLVDGRLCVYAAENRQVVVLNETATEVWSLVDGRTSVDQIVNRLTIRYGRTPELVEGVASVLDDLGNAGLFRSGTGTTAYVEATNATSVQTRAEPGDGWRLQALGLTTEIQCQDPALDATLRKLLRDLTDDDAGAHHVPDVVVSVNGEGPWQIHSPGHSATATNVTDAIDQALAAVNLSAVMATPTLAMHAAVVTRHGETLVIPGPSGQGKTTLTTALLQHGWRYVSDEALALRWSDGSLVPYPRPLALSPWAATRLGVLGVAAGHDVVMPASDVGTVAREVPAPRRIVLLHRDGSETPALEPVHRAEGVAELLRRGFTHFQQPERALTLLAEVVAGAHVHRLRHSDPTRAAAFLSTPHHLSTG